MKPGKHAAVTLDAALAALQRIAPLELAADWDNVGLLVDPRGSHRRRVARVLLTIDLTAAVAADARAFRADLVVAYHPVIFQGLKRLSAKDGKQRAVLDLAAAGCAVWSPHTALDAVAGGVADWLADGVLAGDEAAAREPCGDGGFGRVVTLPRAIALSELVRRCKRCLGVRTLQIARANDRVRTIAVAAGAAASVLRGVAADAWLTGEVSHHDALAAVDAGTSVLAAGHSNTERGYLKVLRRRLQKELGPAVTIVQSRSDRDPFTAV